MVEIFLWCAVATGSYGFDIVECYDTETKCVEDFTALECTRCYTHYNQTICPAYGVMTHEIRDR